MKVKNSVTKRFGSFPAAHRQWRHDGHCKTIHGHNWIVDVEFSADRLDENGFVIDVGKLGWLRERIAWFLDHTLLLSEDDPLVEGGEIADKLGLICVVRVVPSASMEGLAKLFFRIIEAELRTHLSSAVVTAVTVWEDEKNSATYRP